jgi:hypothetical protein
LSKLSKVADADSEFHKDRFARGSPRAHVRTEVNLTQQKLDIRCLTAENFFPCYRFVKPMQCLIGMVFWVIQMTLRSSVKRTPEF